MEFNFELKEIFIGHIVYSKLIFLRLMMLMQFQLDKTIHYEK